MRMGIYRTTTRLYYAARLITIKLIFHYNELGRALALVLIYKVYLVNNSTSDAKLYKKKIKIVSFYPKYMEYIFLCNRLNCL